MPRVKRSVPARKRRERIHPGEAECVAARLALSRSEMFSRAVRAFVNRNRYEGVTDRLNRLYPAASSDLDPAIAMTQEASIPHEEW